MQNSRDSSLWRSLAVAFGDGLVFGMGVKLTQTAGRQVIASSLSEPKLPADRPHPPEPAVEIAHDQKVLDSIIAALEARLNEHSFNVGRHLAELEARLALELRSLDQQDHAVARQITADLDDMKQQMIGLHRQFGEAVARIVEEQVAVHVEARVAAMESALATRIATAVNAAVDYKTAALRRELQESLTGSIAAQVTSQVTAQAARLEQAAESKIPAAVETALEPVERRHREQLSRKDREMAALQHRVSDTAANVVDLVQGIGRICRETAEKIAAPILETAGPEAGSGGTPVSDPEPDAPPAPPAAEGPAEVSAEPPVPGFAQPQSPSRLWRVPLVSSFVLAMGSMVMHHYL